MELVFEFIKKSGLADLFVFACISFWCAKFVMGQNWHSEESNNLRMAISIAFYCFGVVLLVTCVATLPQCNAFHRYEQNQNISNVKPTPSVPIGKIEDTKKD